MRAVHTHSQTVLFLVPVYSDCTRGLTFENFSLGKQSIDGDCNQTGQMLAALMG
jgi:hypothetical protein